MPRKVLATGRRVEGYFSPLGFFSVIVVSRVGSWP
jgi:hypothetical protein